VWGEGSNGMVDWMVAFAWAGVGEHDKTSLADDLLTFSFDIQTDARTGNHCAYRACTVLSLGAS
jgi:hypothetical protein